MTLRRRSWQRGGGGELLILHWVSQRKSSRFDLATRTKKDYRPEGKSTWRLSWSFSGKVELERLGSPNGMRAWESCEMQGTVDKLERVLAIALEEGIHIRREWLRGVRGGLVRVGRQPILFVDESLTVSDQWDQVRAALAQLDWTDTPFGEEIVDLLGGKEPVLPSILA